MDDKPPTISPWATLKELSINVSSFEANGRKYFVAKSVSIDRWEAYEIFQIEIGFARTFLQVHEGLKEALDLCNQVAAGKHVYTDMAFTLRDLYNGMLNVGDKQIPPVLKLCALFINREGEDIRFITDEMIEGKVEDWKQEGISMGFFLRFATRSIPGFIEALRAVSLDTSTEPANSTAEEEVQSSDSRK